MLIFFFDRCDIVLHKFFTHARGPNEISKSKYLEIVKQLCAKIDKVCPVRLLLYLLLL